MNFGALSRGFGTCCLRFKTGVATTPARLASGWLARLYREGVEPSGSLQKVSDRSLILLFWIYPGAREVSCRHSQKSWRRDSSFCSDVRRPDDWPPFLDLGFLLGGERLWRLLLARPRALADIDEAPAHGRIGQSFHQRGMKRGDHILRRALGGPQTVPEGRIEPRHACLVECGRVGRGPPAGFGHHGIGFDLAAADLLERARHLGEGQVDLSSDQILDHRRAAAVGYELESSAGVSLE